MESRLFQALKAFKGADGCEANLFEEFKKYVGQYFSYNIHYLYTSNTGLCLIM